MGINRQSAAYAVLFLLILSGLSVSARASDADLGEADSNTNTQKASNANTATQQNPFVGAQEQPAADPGSGVSLTQQMLQILWRLSVAVILSGILAFRPRRNIPLFRRSLFVSQTQILLAVVAAALMMIVGDNTARAFAIFAAVSLVRFRTNIRDPKEVTVLLISLALGLAAGVGRWELGVGLCLFALTLLWLLEFKESEQVVRSMEVTVQTRDTERTQKGLKALFKRYKLDSEVRTLDPETEDSPVGSIMYYLNLRLSVSTDALSDKMLALDPKNIEKIEWSKTKSASDIYQ